MRFFLNWGVGLFLGCMLVSGWNPSHAAGVKEKFVLSLKDQFGNCGGEVTVKVYLNLTTKKKLATFSYGVRHDPQALKIKEVKLGSAVNLDVHWAQHCEFISDAGVTSQVFGCPVVPHEDNAEVLRITYQLIGSPGTTTLSFADDLPGPQIDFEAHGMPMDGEGGGTPNEPPVDLCQAELDDVPIQINLDNDGKIVIVSPETRSAKITSKCPDVSVDAETLDFGEVVLSDSLTRTAVITNSGNASLMVTGIGFADGSSPDFTVASGPVPPLDLAPKASVQVEVQYKPGELGADEGKLVIKSNDADEPETAITLKGAGVPVPLPEIEVVPLVLDFGDAFVGDTEVLVVLIKNLGKAPLVVKNFSIQEGSSPDFSTGAFMDPPFSLAPKACCGIVVNYKPDVVGGIDAGVLVIESNDDDEAVVEVPLSGKGGEKPQPEIFVEPEDLMLNFDSVFIGDSSDKTLVIGNSGPGALHISELELAGESGAFSISEAHSLPITLIQDGSTSVQVRFSPVSEGSFSGTIAIRSDDPDEPEIIVSLNGTGLSRPVPEIDIQPESLALPFGGVFIGESASQTATLRNTGSEILAITRIAIESPSSEFSIGDAHTLPIDLAPGASVEIRVVYSPEDTEADTGTLIIESNDANEGSIAITLTGQGEIRPVADIDVDPTSHDFGQVEVGQDRRLTVTVTNAGSEALNVSAIRFGDGSSASYAFDGLPQLPLVVDVSDTVQFDVVYRPAAIGSDGATVVVESDDPDEGSVSVSLMGSGFAEPSPEIELDPDSIDFDQVSVDSPSFNLFMIRNIGDADLHITDIRLGDCSTSDFTIESAPDTPLTLAPGDFRPVQVSYTPGELGTDSCVIEILSDDASEAVAVVSLVGEGKPPVESIAGDDRISSEGTQVTLDGSSSSTTCSETLHYFWEQISGPAAQDLQESEDGSTITFTLPLVEDGDENLVFQLTVTDECENIDNDEVTVVDVDTELRVANLSLRSASVQSAPAGEGVERLIVFDGQLDWQTQVEDGEWTGVRFNIKSDADLASLKNAAIYLDSNDNGNLDETDVLLDSEPGVRPDNTILFEFNETLKSGEPRRFLLVADIAQQDGGQAAESSAIFVPILLLLGLVGIGRLAASRHGRGYTAGLLIAVCLILPVLPSACHHRHHHRGLAVGPVNPVNEANFELQGGVDVFLRGKTSGVAARITGLPILGPAVQI